MGTPYASPVEELSLPDHVTFKPSFTRNQKLLDIPEVCRFQETILQTAIRQHLLDEANLERLWKAFGVSIPAANTLEILSEKALTQGHIDLLLKQRVPLGTALKVPMEVKLNRAGPKDVLQLRDCMDELVGECPFGILVAAEFSKQAAPRARDLGIRLVRYSLGVDLQRTVSFGEICQSLSFDLAEK